MAKKGQKISPAQLYARRERYRVKREALLAKQLEEKAAKLAIREAQLQAKQAARLAAQEARQAAQAASEAARSLQRPPKPPKAPKMAPIAPWDPTYVASDPARVAALRQKAVAEEQARALADIKRRSAPLARMVGQRSTGARPRYAPDPAKTRSSEKLVNDQQLRQKAHGFLMMYGYSPHSFTMLTFTELVNLLLEAQVRDFACLRHPGKHQVVYRRTVVELPDVPSVRLRG